MKKLFIYKTNKGKFYFESDDTFKNNKTKTVIFEIETDYPDPIKKTAIQKEVNTNEDVYELLKEIFSE